MPGVSPAGGSGLASGALAERRSGLAGLAEAEGDLVRERDLAAAVIETVGALVVVLDRAGRIVQFNRACEQATGYSFAEARGRLLWDLLLVPDEASAVKAVFAELRGGLFPNVHDNYWVAKDGARRLIHWRNTAIFDEQGTPEFIVGTGIDVTEHRQAEDALHEAALRSAAVLETMPDGFLLLSADGVILDVNRAVYEQSGRSREELIGQPIGALSSGESPEVHAQHVAQVRAEGHARFEVVGRRTDGSPRIFEISLSPLSHSGEPALAALARDVTERKEMEAALRASEARLHALIAAGSDIIAVVDAEATVRFVSPSVTRVLGYEVGELTGRSVLTLVHPDDVSRAGEFLGQAIAGSRLGQLDEYRLRHRDGSWRHLEVAGSLPAEEIGLPGLVLNARDVTERKQAKSALDDAHRRTQAILEAMSDGFVLTTPEGVICDINAALCEWAGVTREQAIGRRLDVLTDDLTDDERAEHIRRAMAQGHGRFELTAIGSDGHARPLEVCVSRTTLDGQPFLFSFARDITDRKQAEEALRVQRDLAVALLSATSLDEALSICLATALRVDGMDGGGIYLLEPATGDFRLACDQGLSDGFVEAVSHVPAGSPRACLITVGQPVYTALADPEVMPPEECAPEAFRALAVIPVAHQGCVIACLNVASRTLDEMPAASQRTLETIGAKIGGVIARLQAEEALQQSEARLSALIAAGSDVITMLDADGTIRFSSPSTTRILGYSAEELVGANVFAIVHPDDFARARQAFAIRAREPGVGGKFVELRIRHRDGSWRDVEVIGNNPGEGSGIGGIVLNTRDITARKQASAALAESEAQYRELVESANSIILKIDTRGCVSFFNGFAQRFFGFSEPEILGRRAVGTIVPETDGSGCALGRWMGNLAASPDFCSENETENTTQDGRRVWVRWAHKVLLDDQGEVVGVLCVGNDATDRKRAEDELKARTQELDAILAASPVGIALLRDRKIVWANDALATLLGHDAADVVGLESRVIYPDAAEYERVGRELYGGPDGPGSGQVEARGVRPDGSAIRLHLQGRALAPGDPSQGHIIAASDISWRERAEQSQRLAAVGQLAGGVAHDFNNVLTGIVGFAQLVRTGAQAEGADAQDLEQIEALVDRAAGLVRQLLAFSRQQQLEPVVLNLNDVVANLLKMLRRLIGEDIELVFSPAGDLGNVRADPGQMDQVLINLAVNARDAMPGGGRLAIETANVIVEPGTAAGRAEVAPGAYVRLTVSDTGCGMDEATQARIFEPFFTTKEVGKGTGLGLSTVYGIVTQHNGDIAIRSEVGQGTRFVIHLPREEAEAGEETVTPPPPRTQGHETILLVEDEEAVRIVAARMLEADGYVIRPAASPREAEEVFAAYADEIALLLTDVVMPGGSGVELYESLRAQRPSLGVLFMSGYTDHAALQGRLQEGDLPFLQKPFTAAGLAGRVRQVLDAHNPTPS